MRELEIAKKVVKDFELMYGELEESKGGSHAIANRIALILSDCRVIQGYIRMPQGRVRHWWVELKDGTIIDPLFEMWVDKPFEHIKV